MTGESRFNLDTIAFLVVVALLAVGATWVLVKSGQSQPTSQTGTIAISSPSPSAGTPGEPQETTRPVPAGQLRISAPEADSWVQVRRAGAKGTVLFSGTVKKGNTRVFAAPILWLRLRRPVDVRLRVEGRKIKPATEVTPVEYIIKDGKLERQG